MSGAAALVSLGGVVGLSVVSASAAGGNPVVSVGSASVLEGDVGARSLLIPLTLSAPSSGDLSVSYRVAGVTATGGSSPVKTPGADFNDRKGAMKTVTFKAGSVAKFASVPVFGDTTVEGDESFTVTLSAPSAGLDLGRAVGTGTIIDDDTDPDVRLGVGDASIVEGDTTKRVVKFRVSLSAPASAPVSVEYRIVPATATGNFKSGATAPVGVDLADGLGAVKTLSFPMNAKGVTPVAKVVPVTIYPDTTDEPDETFQIVLSNAQGATLTRDTGIGTIHDDDGSSGGPN